MLRYREIDVPINIRIEEHSDYYTSKVIVSTRTREGFHYIRTELNHYGLVRGARKIVQGIKLTYKLVKIIKNGKSSTEIRL